MSNLFLLVSFTNLHLQDASRLLIGNLICDMTTLRNDFELCETELRNMKHDQSSEKEESSDNRTKEETDNSSSHSNVEHSPGVHRLSKFLTRSKLSLSLAEKDQDEGIRACKGLAGYCGEAGGERSAAPLLQVILDFALSLENGVKKYDKKRHIAAKKTKEAERGQVPPVLSSLQPCVGVTVTDKMKKVNVAGDASSKLSVDRNNASPSKQAPRSEVASPTKETPPTSPSIATGADDVDFAGGPADRWDDVEDSPSKQRQQPAQEEEARGNPGGVPFQVETKGPEEVADVAKDTGDAGSNDIAEGSMGAEEFASEEASTSPEVDDAHLFRQPPPRDECSKCKLSLLPLSVDTHYYQACCGKVVCTGCLKAAEAEDHSIPCPFCSTPAHSSDGEIIKRIMKRVEANDAEAIYQHGCDYDDGGYGLRQNKHEA